LPDEKYHGAYTPKKCNQLGQRSIQPPVAATVGDEYVFVRFAIAALTSQLKQRCCTSRKIFLPPDNLFVPAFLFVLPEHPADSHLPLDEPFLFTIIRTRFSLVGAVRW